MHTIIAILKTAVEQNAKFKSDEVKDATINLMNELGNDLSEVDYDEIFDVNKAAKALLVVMGVDEQSIADLQERLKNVEVTDDDRDSIT